MTPVTESDHAAGPADAPATLVEYGDYQCPDCGDAEPVLQTVRRTMGDGLRFVFRNFPLTDIHPNALPAATATEAADKQGKYWPMHDLLLQNQNALSPRDLLGYAKGLGLDPIEFKKALESRRALETVMQEVREGEANGVRATPTLFVNGKPYEGPLDAAAIVEALSPRSS